MKNLKNFVKALRSGEYTQARGVLKNNEVENCYCVEGLACLLFLKENPDSGFRFENTGFVKDHDEYAVMPVEVRYWLGLDSRFFLTYRNIKEHSMLSLNDSHKLSFEQIADLIDNYIKEKS